MATDAPPVSAAAAALTVSSKGKSDDGNAGAAKASNSPCSVHFGGDDWAPVLALHMLELQRAAELDIASALKDHGFHVGDADAVSGRCASSVTLRPVKDGAVLTYSIPHESSPDRRRQQKALLARYAYPHIWSKYTQVRIETSVVETRHRVFLEGDQWERVLAASTEQISRAFRKDVGTQLHLSVDAVKPPTCTGSLELEFAIQHAATMSKATIDAELMKCSYERTRLVYETLTGFKLLGTAPQSTSRMTEKLENEKASQSDESAGDEHIVKTRHHLRFPGFAWQQVLKEREAALRGAVISDVAEQLSLQESQVTDVSFTSALKVTLVVSHASALTREEIDQLLGDGNFSRTWKLYMETEPPVSTQKHDTLPTADTEVTESMQTSGTTAAFMSSSAADAVTSHHRVRFHGAEWTSVNNDIREELRKAFVADVAIALGVSTDAVQSVIFHRNSPIVEFKLIHAPSLDRQEIARCLSACEFSHTWAAYLHFAVDTMKPSPKRNTTHHCIRFEGSQWGGLLEANSTQLEAALVLDVATSLNLSKSDITDVTFRLGSLIAEMDIRHDAEWSRDATNRRLATCPYTETWALYQRFLDQKELLSSRAPTPTALHAAESFVSLGVDEQPPAPERVGSPEKRHRSSTVTKHRLRLEGDAWDAILQRWRELLMREFTSDVCDATSLLPASVQSLVLSAGSLTADFQLTHEGVPAGDLNQLLADAPFTRTWALYQRFLEQEVPLRGRAPPPTALHATESFVSLGVDKQPAELGATPPPTALHAAESFVSLGVDEQPPAPERVGSPEKRHRSSTVTKHRLRLEGDAWDAILQRWRELLMREFTSDVCDATSLLPASVQSLVLSAGSLTADFQLTHEGVPAGDLNQLLADAPFTRTWALYQRFLEQEVPLRGRAPPPTALHATESFVSLGVDKQPAELGATPPPTALHAAESFVSLGVDEQPPAPERVGSPEKRHRSSTVTKHRLRLEGDAWDAILQRWRELLMREFTSDVCDATSLLPASVQSLALSAGSLTADFQLTHEGVPAGDLNQLLADAPFTRTWALYQRFLEQEVPLRGRAPPPTALHATESFVSLGVDKQPAELGATPPPTALHAAESFVSLGVDEQPPAPERVGSPEKRHRSSTVTKHRLRLEGDAWDAILQRWRELLMREFTSDVCDATSLLPASVQSLVLSAGSLTADFQLTHEGVPAGDLNQLLADAPFTRTWALYQRFLEQEVPLRGRAPPPTALHATESFVSLGVDKQPAELGATPPPTALHAAESFVSLGVDEQPPAPVRVGTPEALLPAVQRATPPPTALHAAESFVSLGVDEQPAELGATPPPTALHAAESFVSLEVDEQPAVQRATPPPTALHAAESFVSLGVDEQPPAPVRVATLEALLPAVQRGTPPPTALHAAESFASLGVDEQPAEPVRVGTPEALLPAVQRGTPPPTALHAAESFVSLGVDEQPAEPVRVGTPEALLPAVQRGTPPPTALHAAESFVSLGVDEQPAEPVRVGTPEALLPAVQRATPPPTALHAAESFVSLGVDEQPAAPVRVATLEALLPAELGATPPPTALHAAESFVSLGVDEQPPAPERVGSPEKRHRSSTVTKHRLRLEGDAWDAILQRWRELLMREFTSDVCDATSLLPASVQSLVLSAGSLTADFQLTHEGVPAGDLNQLLADAPFTRTWALYQRFLEQEVPLRGRAPPPTALHATESFVSLGVDEQPPAPVRVGTPEALLPAVQRATPPPTALHAAESFVSLGVDEQPTELGATPPPTALHAAESFVSLGVDEQPPAPVRVATLEALLPAVQRGTPPPTALHAAESFVSLGVDEQPAAPVRVATLEALLPAELGATPPPTALHAAESFVSLGVDEQPAEPVRVGTPEALLPAVQRATPPPTALHAAESFVSLGVDEQPAAPVRVATLEALLPAELGATPPPTALHAAESFVSLGVDEQPPAPERVGSPEKRHRSSTVTKHRLRLEGDAWDAILQRWRELLMREFTSDVCDATSLLPASVQSLVLSAGSLTADFQLTHEGVPAGDLNQLLADAPFTRTWALYQRFLEQEVPLRGRAPPPTALHATESFVSLGVDEQPAVQRATPPPTALHAAESFVSLGVDEQPPAPVRVATLEALLPAVQRGTPPPTALHAAESFVSLGVDEQPAAPVRVGTPEALLLAVQRATPPPTALHAAESFASLGVDEQPAEPVRVGTPEALLPAVQRGTPPPTALHAAESFVSLGVDEQPREPVRVATLEALLPAVQRGTPPPTALHAAESFVSLGVDEQPAEPVSVGTPEALLLAVQRATPPPTALHAAESFVSLGVDEQPAAPVRVATLEALLPAELGATPPPTALHAAESFASLGVDEQPAEPVRVGTPEALLPAVQRGTPPPTALHATESFVSLGVDKQPAELGATPPPTALHAAESFASLGVDEQPAAPGRVGTPEALLPAVQRGKPPTALHAAESFVSLGVDEQPAAPVRVGTPEALLPAVQRATPPPTALHAAESFASLEVDEQPAVPVRVGTPEALLPAVQRATPPPTALHAAESFASLEVDVQPAEPVRVGTPEALLPAVQRATPPPTALHAAESFASLEVDEQPAVPVRVGTPEALLPAVQRATPPPTALHAAESFVSLGVDEQPAELGATPPPTALHAAESFASLEVDVQPAEPVRVGTPEALLPAVQRATPPPTALHAAESFASLEVDEQPAVPVRVGTPEALLPAVQRATPPPTALHAAESFVSLGVDEQPAELGATPPPTALHAAESFVSVGVDEQPAELGATPPPTALHAAESFASLGVDEQPAAPVRVGTPEALLPAVQRATPPPTALHAAESFASLEVDVQPAEPVRVGTPEALLPAVQRATPPPTALHAAESFASLEVDVQPAEPVRVGTPEELLLAVQRATPPPTALHAAESFVSLGVDEQPAELGATPPPTALHAAESFVSLGVDEQPAAPVRVATLEALLPAVQRGTPPPTALHAAESFVSLGVDEQPAAPVRVGTPEALLPAVQRATPPPTALHAAESFVSLEVDVQPAEPGRVGTPEALLPSVQRGTPPPTALHAAESFASLGVDEQPAEPVRVGTPEELLLAVQRATPPPTALHAAESFASLGVDEQPAEPVRVGTPEELLLAVQRATPPPTALHAAESFVSLGVDEQPAELGATQPPTALHATESSVLVNDGRRETASVAVSVEVAPACELSHRASEPQAYSRDDLAGSEAAVLPLKHEPPKDECLPPQLEESSVAVSVGVAPACELSHRASEPQAYSRDDLAGSEAAVLPLKHEPPKDECLPPQLEESSVAVSVGVAPARELSHRASEPQAYSRDDLAGSEAAVLPLKHEPPKDECLPPQLEESSVAVSVGVAPARELSHRASEPQAYSRDHLAGSEAAVLPLKHEPPKDECLPPQLEEASVAVSVGVAPARELSHRASEPQAYSRDDLAGSEAAVLPLKHEPPKDECLPPQLEESSVAVSVGVAPARELSHRASEPQAYSRDHLAGSEAAVLPLKHEPPKDECLPPQLEEASVAVSVEVAPARELSHRASEPQAYSRDDLAGSEAAVLPLKHEPPKDECLPPQLEESSVAVSVGVAPARELSHRASEPQAYSRDDLAGSEAAVLPLKHEPPKDECLPPQLEESSVAVSVGVAPARELSHRASEPQAYSRDDLAGSEAAVLPLKHEPPKDECLPPQLEESSVAVSVGVAPARELSHRASEPQAYSRDDLAGSEAAVLPLKHEPPKDECLPPQLEESSVAVSVGVAPARELSHRASEPQAYSRDDLAGSEAAVLPLKHEPPKDECLPPQLEESSVAVSVGVAPARELSHRASEPQAYSRDHLAGSEAAVLPLKHEPPKDECLPPQLEESSVAVSVGVAPARELSHRASEPQAYSRDHLAGSEAAVLPLKHEPPKDECLPPQLEESSVAVSVGVAPARELSHRASEPQAYSRDDLAGSEAAVLPLKHEPPKDECLPPQLEESSVAVSVGVAPARELSHRASEPQAYSRDDLAGSEAAVLPLKHEPPKDECLPPQLEESSVAVSVGVAPARELSHRASEPQAYSRDDLAGSEAAVLPLKHEPPKDECLPPQLEESSVAVSVGVAPARELSHRASEPQAYSRDDLAGSEAAVLPLKHEPPKDECLPPQLEEASVAVSVEVAPARELSHRASEPQAYSRDDLAGSEAAVLREVEITVGSVSLMSDGDAYSGKEVLLSCSADAGVVVSLGVDNISSVPGGGVCACAETVRRLSGAEVVVEASPQARVTRHTVMLDGRHWFKVISCVLADALRRDVATALSLPLSDVQEVEVMSGSLIGTFAVVHSCDTLTASDVDRLLKGYHFPLTWEHYPTTPETTVGCVFETEELSGTRCSSRALESAVEGLSLPTDAELCVTESCALKPHPPLPVAEEASRSALSSCGRTYSAPMMAQAERESASGTPAACIAVSLSKKHSTVSISPSSVVQEHPSHEVSEPLMELSRDAAPAPVTTAVMPPEVTETVSTKHRVGFVGKGWTCILKTQKDEFVAAVIKGTGEQLGFALDSVDKVLCDEDTGDTIVTFHVTHPSALPSKHIDVVLRSAPFADVWKLYYENAPAETQEKTDAEVTTFHRVGFVGGKWRDLISRDYARFNDAFVADSATALSVTPQAVKIADYAVADDIVVDFYVSHPVADSEELVDSKLEQFDYQRVWDLYGTVNQVDEQQRVVPCVMKRSPTSRLKSPPSPPLVRMPLTSSIFPIEGFCPSCRRRFSPQQEFPQSFDSGSWFSRPVHRHASSVCDTVGATLTEGSSLALRRPSPLPQIARRISPHEGCEWPALQPPSVQRMRGTSLTRSAQTVPRAPWYPSGNNLIPHPPRGRSPSKTKRRHQRRINLRELESEVSRRQRQRKHQERQEQLDREMRRSLNCSRSSLSAGATANFPQSFLPIIPARYTKVPPSLQHRHGPGFLMQ
ncbi:hypothetical protein CUR178_02091 [Leishmania enriettii]|uniref:Flagellar attachment zone protein 1 conserved domain-containing protein n=1 Tax=Leishmania enriettii TaxID=5663 RepID=A0A836GAX2_LEIEN|nr:hypothetical protein CUR178_02091 [Leishmania enriettii]